MGGSHASAVGEFEEGKKLSLYKFHSGKQIKWILPSCGMKHEKVGVY